MRGAEYRTRHLDGLRIIAAVSVVVMHYLDYVRNHHSLDFVFIHVQHFNLFVDLFFVISGFIISSQYLGRVGDQQSTLRFLWRRLARIYPLHLVTLTFYIAVAGVAYFGFFHGDNPARYPASDIPAQLLLLHAIIGERLTFNFPSWSLSAEMFCYLLFPLIAALAIRQRWLIAAAFVITILAISVSAVAFHSWPWIEWINRGGIFRAVPSFLFGTTLYLFRTEIGRWSATLPPVTPVLAGFIFFGSRLPESLQLGSVYLVVLLALRSDLTDQDTLLTWLGFERWSKFTYSSYMLHIPIATVVLTFAGRYVAPLVPDARLALLPVAAVVLVVASYLSYRFFETPMRVWLCAAFDRRRPVAAPLGSVASEGEAG